MRTAQQLNALLLNLASVSNNAAAEASRAVDKDGRIDQVQQTMWHRLQIDARALHDVLQAEAQRAEAARVYAAGAKAGLIVTGRTPGEIAEQLAAHVKDQDDRIAKLGLALAAITAERTTKPRKRLKK